MKCHHENKERNKEPLLGVYFSREGVVPMRTSQNIKWMLNKWMMIKGLQRYQKLACLFSLMRVTILSCPWCSGHGERRSHMGSSTISLIQRECRFKADWGRWAGDKISGQQPVRCAKWLERVVEILNSALPVTSSAPLAKPLDTAIIITDNMNWMISRCFTKQVT